MIDENVLFVANDKYVPILAVAIKSLLDNSKRNERIHIHVFENDICNTNKKKLRALTNEEGSLTFYNISKLISGLERTELGAFKGNMLTYCRLFCEKILPVEIKRVVYLDCDVMICGSIKELFTMNMGNNVISAVRDIINYNYRFMIKIKKPDNYTNAGIIVIDLDKWREEKCSEKIDVLLKHNKIKYYYADQDMINIFFEGRVKILPPKYCVFYPVYRWKYKDIIKFIGIPQDMKYYTENELKEASDKPVIIHLTGLIYGQPWKKRNYCKEYDEWHRYLNKAGFGKDFKMFISNESNISWFYNYVIYKFFPHKIWLAIYLLRYKKHCNDMIARFQKLNS